jgi:hypothetical protein
MGSVFKNSFLTIAATSSVNCEQGFLSDDWRKRVPSGDLRLLVNCFAGLPQPSMDFRVRPSLILIGIIWEILAPSTSPIGPYWDVDGLYKSSSYRPVPFTLPIGRCFGIAKKDRSANAGAYDTFFSA